MCCVDSIFFDFFSDQFFSSVASNNGNNLDMSCSGETGGKSHVPGSGHEIRLISSTNIVSYGSADITGVDVVCNVP